MKNHKAAMMAFILLLSTASFLILTDDGAVDSLDGATPFGDKRGEGESAATQELTSIHVDYYAKFNGNTQYSIYFILGEVPSLTQLTILISPVGGGQSLVWPTVGAETEFFVVSQSELVGSQYLVSVWAFGSAMKVAECTLTMFGDPCTITFDANGGTGTMASETVAKNVKYTLPECGFTPPASSLFKAWEVKGTEYSVGSEITITEDTTVKAIWKAEGSITYELTYDANQGTGAPEKESYTGTEASHTFTISWTSPTRSGYTFLGWSDTATGQAQYLPGTEITLQSGSPTKTIYAIWQSSPTPPGPTPVTRYSLSFDANGGSGAPPKMSATSSQSSYSFRVPDTIPVWSGHTFYGWSDTATGQAQYQPGGSVVISATSPSKTIYAVWNASPIIPEVESFEFDADDLFIPSGKTYRIPYTVEPVEAAPGLTWSSSDTSVMTVSTDGTVKALKEGKVTITVRDQHGTVLGRMPVEVTSQSQEDVEEETETEDGGSVIASYAVDSEGNKTLVNPIVINPGTQKKVTDDQTELAKELMDILEGAGTDPHVVIPTEETSVGVPTELLDAIIDGDGSLTIESGDVSMTFPANVLDSIGTDYDLEFRIIPVESTDTTNVDLDNAKTYDLVIFRNGEKYSKDFPSKVSVTIDYEMKEGWDPKNLHVWYVDVDPYQEIEFTYDKDTGVTFGVSHFSKYAVSYEAPEPVTPSDSNTWIWIVIVVIVLLVLIAAIYLWMRRRTV